MELVHFPSSPPPFPPAPAKSGSKILAWSFLASILINVGIGIGLSFAHFNSGPSAPVAENRARILLYRPPVAPPKKSLPLLVRPKPVTQKRETLTLPHSARSVTVKPMALVITRPPMAAPRVVPQPVRPAALPTAPSLVPRSAPTVAHPMAMPTSRAPIVTRPVTTETQVVVNAGPMRLAPQETGTQKPGRDTAPLPVTVPQSPVQSAPAQPQSVQPDKNPPAPQAAVRQETIAPEPAKPANYRDVTSQEAELTDVPQPDTSGIDPSTLTGPCVITFEIDENGHVSSPRIKQRSGSSDFDEACLRAIRRARGVPAIQDHIAHAQRCERTFNAG